MSNNGWNSDELASVVRALDNLYDTKYEIENCVRGCRTGAETYKELGEYLKKQAQALIDAAECCKWIQETD